MDGTKDTLKPVLSEKVSGTIWKILINEESRLLAVESRDADNRQVYFSIFNYAAGIGLLRNKALHERWNLTAAHLAEQLLLIKLHPDEGSPVSKGIIAMDCKTGEIIWERYNSSFHNIWQEGLEVFNPDLLPRKTLLLDIETGNELTNVTTLSPLSSSVILPDIADEQIIPAWLPHRKITGDVHYTEKNGKTFLSFHEQIAGGLQLRLVGYMNNDLLIDDILIKDIQKLHPETFFIVQNHLFCTKWNNEIISYLV